MYHTVSTTEGNEYNTSAIESFNASKVIDEAYSRKNKKITPFQFIMKAGISTALTIAPSSTALSSEIYQVENNDTQVVEFCCDSDKIVSVASPLRLSQDLPSSEYRDADLTIYDLTSYIRNHLDWPGVGEIAARIEFLNTCCLEEGPEQAPVSESSLCGFIDFLQASRELLTPDIVVSLTGNICAEWHKSFKEHLSVEFYPNGQAKYVVFSQDSDFQSRVDKSTGVVSTGSLLKKIMPFNVLDWIAA